MLGMTPFSYTSISSNLFQLMELLVPLAETLVPTAGKKVPVSGTS